MGFFDLTGHVALVTGGNAGLGLAMARGLAKAGADIAIWGRKADRNAQAVAELEALGAKAAGFVCDVTDEAQIVAAMAATLERFGRVDSCFANAGGSGRLGPSLKLPLDDWRAAMELNITSVIATFQAAGKVMVAQGKGRLIVTSSVAAVIGLPGGGYSATKAAVSGLIRTLAVELAPKGITANAILPGYIETEMSLNTPQVFRDAVHRRAASGKIGTLEDMEGIAVYLASEQSRFMTGQSLVIDGGHSIYPF